MNTTSQTRSDTYERRLRQAYAEGDHVRVLVPLYGPNDEYTGRTGTVTRVDNNDVEIDDDLWVTKARISKA
jgi:transcription elongation factor